MNNRFQGYPVDQWQPAKQQPFPSGEVVATPEKVEYVTFSVDDANMMCGVDAVTRFTLVRDIVGREFPGEYNIYNRLRDVKVLKENWLDRLEQILIGKPGLLIFSRKADAFGNLNDTFDQPELLKMVEADSRCTLLASYLNRTGPHAERPNHLKFFMFHGKHENPEA